MTEPEITQEMAAIEMTLRALKAQRRRNEHNAEIKKLEERHAILAKELQKFQLQELKGKTND